MTDGPESPRPDEVGVKEPAVVLTAPRDGTPEPITDAETLDRAVARLAAGTGPLAVDAERASGYRYTPRAYLVQLRREGAEAWDGTMRLVAYIQSDLDPSEAMDQLLPEVAWSWLVEALEARAEHVTALGGTVTATTSVRYGDISGPPRAHQLELRASWTATTLALGPHVEAFCEVLEHAAGLPPSGVTDLSSRTRA